jgi:L-lactate dehydrogenase (cytochrome)
MEDPVRIDRCNNIGDFRAMARRRLPGPIFHYIDGAADDEVTYRRNTEAYGQCDLVPNVLAGVESIDMSTTVMGQKIHMPLFCSPTALQRLFHHDGERAVAKAAEKFGTMFGISSVGTMSIEEIGSSISPPKLFQLYFHKDRGLTNSMIERCGGEVKPVRKSRSRFPPVIVSTVSASASKFAAMRLKGRLEISEPKSNAT